MAKELDDFLGDEPGQAEADAPSAAVETPEALVAEPEGQQPALPAEPAAIEDDTETTGNPVNFRKLREAVEATKKERNDYKGERDRLQGEMAAIKAELEAARKAPPAAPVQEEQPEPLAIPNPVEDPQGYHAYQQRMLFNERLNQSEMMLRDQHDDVDEKMAVFKQAATANPALRSELTRQVHPYRWAYQQAQRIMAMEEIGGDPAAYRAKVEAELRAKWEAEYTGTQPQAATRIQLPQSLGTARSAGSRSTPVINVAESFDDILAVGRK